MIVVCNARQPYRFCVPYHELNGCRGRSTISTRCTRRRPGGGTTTTTITTTTTTTTTTPMNPKRILKDP